MTNISKGVELIDKINTNREFVATAISGLQEYNNSYCKIFLGVENISIYTLKPTLKLVKKFSNNEIIDFKLCPTEEVVEIPNNSHIKGGIIGFLLGGWIGAIVGAFIGSITQYKTINVYDLVLITESESLCFRIKE